MTYVYIYIYVYTCILCINKNIYICIYIYIQNMYNTYFSSIWVLNDIIMCTSWHNELSKKRPPELSRCILGDIVARGTALHVPRFRQRQRWDPQRQAIHLAAGNVAGYSWPFHKPQKERNTNWEATWRTVGWICRKWEQAELLGKLARHFCDVYPVANRIWPGMFQYSSLPIIVTQDMKAKTAQLTMQNNHPSTPPPWPLQVDLVGPLVREGCQFATRIHRLCATNFCAGILLQKTWRCSNEIHPNPTIFVIIFVNRTLWCHIYIYMGIQHHPPL